MADDVIRRAREVLDAALVQPWRALNHIVTATDGAVVVRGVDRDDTRAIVLAVNTLPELLDLAEAVQKYRHANLSTYEPPIDAAYERLCDAHDALHAALARELAE
jgi:hypothetical protein